MDWMLAPLTYVHLYEIGKYIYYVICEVNRAQQKGRTNKFQQLHKHTDRQAENITLRLVY